MSCPRMQRWGLIWNQTQKGWNLVTLGWGYFRMTGESISLNFSLIYTPLGGRGCLYKPNQLQVCLWPHRRVVLIDQIVEWLAELALPRRCISWTVIILKVMNIHRRRLLHAKFLFHFILFQGLETPLNWRVSKNQTTWTWYKGAPARLWGSTCHRWGVFHGCWPRGCPDPGTRWKANNKGRQWTLNCLTFFFLFLFLKKFRLFLPHRWKKRKQFLNLAFWK